MTDAPPLGVVLDTMVFSWLLDDRPNPLGDRYRDLIGQQPVLLAFQTVMELRYGALRAAWGELRRRRLERRIAELTVVQPDDEMFTACANLHLSCQQIGHALADRRHDGDRWIAAAAMRLDVALVSHDGVFDQRLPPRSWKGDQPEPHAPTVSDGGPRSATATATTRVRVWTLASFNFRPILRSHPTIAENLMVLLCRRLRASEDAADTGPG